MKKKDTTLVSQSQMSIKQALKSNFYPKDSKKQLAITRKLAVFVGTTNAPISVVDGPEFRDLLTETNGQYEIPGRKKVAKEIENVYTELKHTISLVLQNAKRIKDKFLLRYLVKAGNDSFILRDHSTLLYFL